MVDLRSKPFYLSDEDIDWVQATMSRMDLKDKVGQLFFPIGTGEDKEALKQIVEGIKPAGFMYRTGPMEEIQEMHHYLQSISRIPLLLAANLETGGQGIAQEGTLIGNQLQVAATDDPAMAYKLGLTAAREGAAVGCNWAFAPVVDIDMNFRNPITNLRTYGSSAQRVAAMGSAYMKAVHETGLGVSVKHFPGDGVDERDQHLLTSVNSLSTEEWDQTYGMVYQRLIDEGAQTVMVGHIAQPAYEQYYNGLENADVATAEPIPATLSGNLLQNLLRGKLGFNGLITTDASLMLGFTCAEARETAVPKTIASGCDLLLFNLNMEEDFQFMMQGVQNGLLTEERIAEAVTRILGFKAALGLHRKQAAQLPEQAKEALQAVGCPEHIEWAKECADRAITLVKDTQDLLPLSPVRHRRILLYPLGGEDDNFSLRAAAKPYYIKFAKELEKRGFIVTIRYNEASDMTAMLSRSTMKMKQKYDLVIYLANRNTASNQTVVRLNFDMLSNSPWFVREVATMFLSIANPYHLLDAPMMKTFVNAYTDSPYVLEALAAKICGESEFYGINPVDPFCGRADTVF